MWLRIKGSCSDPSDSVKTLREGTQPQKAICARHHSINAASFCRDSLPPISLSSGRTPSGIPSQSTMTSVPPSASARLQGILISPMNPGSCDSNSTAHTILSKGTSSRNLPCNMSVSSEVLPRCESSGFWQMQCHSEFASFARFEDMHTASHAFRWKPRGHCVPANEGLIYGLTPCLDNRRNACARSFDGWLLHAFSFTFRKRQYQSQDN